MELGKLSKRLSQYCWLVPDIKDTFITKGFFILMHLGGDICFMCAGVGKGKKRLSDPGSGISEDCEQPDMYAGS